MCSVTGLPRSFPLSRIPDPMTAPPLRWGVLAPGKIAGAFADAVHRNTCQRVVAVGSRSSDRAKAFAAQHGAERAFGSYEQLVADPGVDAVYVASPHSEHRSLALLAIAAGKPVLVEKAFTRNAIEAREVVSAARAQKVLVMEAMWTRFLPQMDVIAQLLDRRNTGHGHDCARRPWSVLRRGSDESAVRSSAGRRCTPGSGCLPGFVRLLCPGPAAETSALPAS